MSYNISNPFDEIKEIPLILNQKILPSLNGLRAVSVLMVVAFHFEIKYFHFLNIHFAGALGVNIFFVISGFLITTLCIKEKITTNHLSLKNFYIRRALRILPVAYLYILVIIILIYYLNLNITYKSAVSAALFVSNISWFQKISFEFDVGHYWSLATEEQFYLLFPFLLHKSFRLFVATLLFVCFAAPALVHLRPYINFLNNGVILSMLRYTLKFQGIATGCLFSVLLFKGYFNFGRYNLGITLFSIFALYYLQLHSASDLTFTFTNLIISISIGLLVVNNITYTDNIIYKFLNLKILSFIGMMSYSIYIWQELFLSNDPDFVLSKYPVNLLFLIIVPCLSYLYYERYFLKFKKAFTPKLTPPLRK